MNNKLCILFVAVCALSKAGQAFVYFGPQRDFVKALDIPPGGNYTHSVEQVVHEYHEDVLRKRLYGRILVMREGSAEKLDEIFARMGDDGRILDENIITIISRTTRGDVLERFDQLVPAAPIPTHAMLSDGNLTYEFITILFGELAELRLQRPNDLVSKLTSDFSISYKDMYARDHVTCSIRNSEIPQEELTEKVFLASDNVMRRLDEVIQKDAILSMQNLQERIQGARTNENALLELTVGQYVVEIGTPAFLTEGLTQKNLCDNWGAICDIAIKSFGLEVVNFYCPLEHPNKAELILRLIELTEELNQ